MRMTAVSILAAAVCSIRPNHANCFRASTNRGIQTRTSISTRPSRIMEPSTRKRRT